MWFSGVDGYGRPLFVMPWHLQFLSFHCPYVQGHVWMMGLQEEKVGGTSGLIAEETGILGELTISVNGI